MGLYRVQYKGVSEELPGVNQEDAWDSFKSRTGKRRDILAEQRGEIEPPAIQELTHDDATGSTDAETGDTAADKPKRKRGK